MVRQGGEEDDDRGAAGWDQATAVRNGHIYEIKSTYILQPGPASLTEGVRQLHDCIARSLPVSPD